MKYVAVNIASGGIVIAEARKRLCLPKLRSTNAQVVNQKVTARFPLKRIYKSMVSNSQSCLHQQAVSLVLRMVYFAKFGGSFKAVMSSSASLSSSSSSTSISSTSRVSLDGSRLRSSIFSLSAVRGGGCLDFSSRCFSSARIRRSSSAAAIFSKLGISRSAHALACAKSSFTCVTSSAQSPSRST